MQDKETEQTQGYKYSEGKQETPGTNEGAELQASGADNKGARPGRRYRTKQQQKHMAQEKKTHGYNRGEETDTVWIKEETVTPIKGPQPCLHYSSPLASVSLCLASLLQSRISHVS